jgi:hypothetical protein
MTRDELITLAKFWLDERGNFYSTAQLNTAANFANRMVYRAVANQSPSHFAQISTFSYPADTEKVDLSGGSYLNERPYRMLAVQQLPSGSTVSATNRPQTIEYISPNTNHADDIATEDPNVWQSAGLYWTMDTDVDLYLLPMPASAIDLRVRWIGHLANLAAGSTSLLGGKATEFHDLVAAVMTKTLQQKERNSDQGVTELLVWIGSQVEMAEASREVAPRVIFESPY